MAFTVTGDHARQEQVWAGLERSYTREPYYIRRQLTEGAAHARDKRARFVGAAAYEQAGGVILRDMFDEDQGGWFQDAALLDRLAVEKLTAAAEALRPEGLRIERGYVRPEDDVQPDASPGMPARSIVTDPSAPAGSWANPIAITVGGDQAVADAEASDEDEGVKPLSERLVMELQAQRTLELRNALAGDPEIASIAVLHALCLQAFYHFGADSCLEIRSNSAGFACQPPGMRECDAAKAIDARQEAWQKRLPKEAGELWEALIALDPESRAALLAHCAGQTVNAVQSQLDRAGGRLAHAGQLARALGFDMAASWQPTVENYLGRVTKARILAAVTEAKGEPSAQLIDHLKKGDMAKEAERLLAGTGWLPEPLRLAEPEGSARRSPGIPGLDARGQSRPQRFAQLRQRQWPDRLREDDPLDRLPGRARRVMGRE